MKKLILFVLSVLFICGSTSLFAERKITNEIPDEIWDTVTDVLKETSETDSLEQGEFVGDGKISFFVPEGWVPLYYNRKLQGVEILYYISAENNAANVILQRAYGDTEGLEPEDYLYASINVVETMYDDLEIIEDMKDRVVYKATLQGIEIYQDLYCLFSGNDIYCFSASVTADNYPIYKEYFDKIYSSVTIQ